MRIAMVVAGAGRMYCGSCARDAHLAKALHSKGHDCAFFPIYTPVRMEAEMGFAPQPLRLGGINAYLHAKFPVLSGLPVSISRLLDKPAVIDWASQFSVQTQASDLGRLAYSFLTGADGPHEREIRTLAADIATFQPDVVVLANSLLSGLIGPLRKAAGVPVVCQVQGEDGFLDELPKEWRAKVESILKVKVKEASHYIAPCESHAQDMTARLGLPFERFSIVPPSIRTFAGGCRPRTGGSVRIGHLSSIRRAKGLDLLVDAMAELKDLSLSFLVRGKVLEPEYHTELIAQATRLEVTMDVGGEVLTQDKIAFLTQCDFTVLPSRLNESRGIVALESLALGTPVIAPARGIFPELAQVTGGVALYPLDGSLAQTIRECVIRRDEWRENGLAAARVVGDRYSGETAASAAIACFDRLR